MPRYGTNLTLMSCERPFLEGLGAAAPAGLSAVEFVSPYEHEPTRLAAGWVGCEHRPLTTTGAGLGWMRAYAPGAGGR